MLNKAGYRLYDGSRKKEEYDLIGGESGKAAVDFRTENGETYFTFRAKEELKGASFFCEYTVSGWTGEDYLMIPAAVYAGNRFRKIAMKYPPFLSRKMGASAQMEPILTDVPGLSQDGRGAIFLTTADTACPCVAIYLKKQEKGILLFTKVQQGGGNTGIEIREDFGRGELYVIFNVPNVREGTMYRFGTTQAVSEDRGKDYKSGEEEELYVKMHTFACRSVHDLYREFFYLRKESAGSLPARKIDLPLYDAFEIIEGKYNRSNWDKSGYYRVGTVDNLYQDWQAGWTGGLINTYPLLVHGSALSVRRSGETLRFILENAVRDSGFLHAILYNGCFYGDNFNDVNDRSVLLIRKHCDALYFLLRQMQWDEAHGQKVFDAQMKGQVRRCAEALVRLWKKEEQLGQFIDADAVEIYAGGTASGAVAAGALALAYSAFSDEKYLRAAEEIAAYYENNHLDAGFVNGGPGEICQGPDSESIFGLLESYITLYEQTGEDRWLRCAERTAWQCSSWCVTYAYRFPQDSCFGKRRVNTVGSVFANVQNKHSAPGICTLSGDSLLKLYRYTREGKYLELLADIAGNITQYLSTERDPVYDYGGKPLPYGFMNERVNISDWEGKECVGGVFDGSCWAEISCMLTYLQIPGIYIDFAGRRYYCLENLEAEADWEKGEVRVVNARRDDLIVKVFLDEGSGPCRAEDLSPIKIKAGETMVWQRQK